MTSSFDSISLKLAHALAFMASSSAFPQPQDLLGHPVADMAALPATTSLGVKGSISLCLSCNKLENGQWNVKCSGWGLGHHCSPRRRAIGHVARCTDSSPNTEDCHSQERLRRTESKALTRSSNFIGSNSIKHSGNSKHPRDIFPEQPQTIFAIFPSDVAHVKQKEVWRYRNTLHSFNYNTEDALFFSCFLLEGIMNSWVWNPVRQLSSAFVRLPVNPFPLWISKVGV